MLPSWLMFTDSYVNTGLLTSCAKTTKDQHEIAQLLETIWLSLELAIIHWPGHQRDKSPQLKATTTQLKLSKRLLLGNPNPRLSWSLLLSLGPTLPH